MGVGLGAELPTTTGIFRKISPPTRSPTPSLLPTQRARHIPLPWQK